MEKFPQIPEHPALPELQLPEPLPEIEQEKKISPNHLDDLIKNTEKQWDEDEKRKDKDTPTIH